MTEPLPVRLSDAIIGELRPDNRFAWAEDWGQLGPLNAPLLSHSLPFGVPDKDSGPFFGGLLPEGIGLERLAREAGIASNNLYGLLAEVGADVGGGVTIGEPRPPLEPIALGTEDFETILNRAAGYLRGVAVGGGGSAATGVQAKVALTFDAADGAWMLGRGSTPSTHILKPVSAEFEPRIRAESYLNALARTLDLASHDTHLAPAGARSVLVVQRYDRKRDDSGKLIRVHQEDAAQALGLPWGGNDKYENVNSRANLRAIAGLLDQGRSVFASAAQLPSDREKLLRLVVLNVVSGNTDAHAKNFSLILPELGTGRRAAQFADAYDLVPQELFTAESPALAMRIDGQAVAGAVTVRHLVHEGASWGLGEALAEQNVTETLMRIVQAVGRSSVDPGDRRLPEFLSERAENLLRGDRVWTRPSPPALMR